MWAATGIHRRRLAAGSEEAAQSPNVSDGVTVLAETEELVPGFAELSMLETVNWDHETTSHSTLAHPLEPYRDRLRKHGLPDAHELTTSRDGSVVSYAGMVICRQRPGTANGVVFVTLEDEAGFVNLILWQNIFDRFRAIVLTSSFLGVTGKLQRSENVIHIVVHTCWKPSQRIKPQTLASRDFR